MGISQEMIYHALGIGGLESISTDDLIWLHAIMTSIKEGSMTVSEVFGNSMEPVKAQVPARGRGRPPKEVPVDIGTEKVPEPDLHFVEQALPVEEPHAPPVPPPPPPPPQVTPPYRTREESSEPFPEPKPVRKKESPPPAPAPVEMPGLSGADQIRAKLTEAGLTEENLINWLDDLGTVKDGTVSLETVNAKWLRMVLDDWAGILARVREFLGRQKQ
jgi:outer membrane biosynthesis protein TonB